MMIIGRRSTWVSCGSAVDSQNMATYCIHYYSLDIFYDEHQFGFRILYYSIYCLYMITYFRKSATHSTRFKSQSFLLNATFCSSHSPTLLNFPNPKISFSLQLPFLSRIILTSISSKISSSNLNFLSQRSHFIFLPSTLSLSLPSPIFQLLSFIICFFKSWILERYAEH